MKERIVNILSNLKNVEEDLLALSDDIWLEIDHNDNEAIKNGTQFKLDFNQKNIKFTEASSTLAKLIEDFTKVSLYSNNDKASVEKYIKTKEVNKENKRLIAELNNRTPHTLREDFKYKRPYGIVFEGIPYENKKTWSEVYIQVCKHLYNKDTTLFKKLSNNPDHISSRGNHSFSTTPSNLRTATMCCNTTYVEMNLSANQIRDSIIRLLKTFKINQNDLSIFLREDRDA